jgi:hypothetical protein
VRALAPPPRGLHGVRCLYAFKARPRGLALEWIARAGPPGGNHIGCEGARALGASLAQLPQLDTLLVNRGVEIPVRALREGTVARLDFAHTTLQPEDAVLVAAAIRCGAEERVNRLRLSPDNCAWAKVRACVHGGPCLAAGLSMCAGLGGVRFSLGGYIG